MTWIILGLVVLFLIVRHVIFNTTLLLNETQLRVYKLISQAIKESQVLIKITELNSETFNQKSEIIFTAGITVFKIEVDQDLFNDSEIKMFENNEANNKLMSEPLRKIIKEFLIKHEDDQINFCHSLNKLDEMSKK